MDFTEKTLVYLIRAGKWFSENYKLWATFALVISLMYDTSYLEVKNALKSPNSLPTGQRQMSKGDKSIEALKHQMMPHNDLAAKPTKTALIVKRRSRSQVYSIIM